ncbi:PH domain-containing protein [Microlunatus sp. GCM10028923]|uniref:PH domain-containing protein n=1 Tax=Microlunatus sp. GCM10028923 TaxID=3273400 RepID=UPI00360C862A
MDDLFAPPQYEWKRLAPPYRTLRRLTTAVGLVVFIVPAVIFGVMTQLWWVSAIVIALGLAITVPRWLLVERHYRSWGYVEREDDLYITHGVMFRTLIAVPYGRMQLVEVESGPLERALGLAHVTLVTASASTNATIPGLVPDEAARLRDSLTQLGEAHASGL